RSSVLVSADLIGSTVPTSVASAPKPSRAHHAPRYQPIVSCAVVAGPITSSRMAAAATIASGMAYRILASGDESRLSMGVLDSVVSEAAVAAGHGVVISAQPCG